MAQNGASGGVPDGANRARMLIGLVLAALIVWFILGNNESAKVRFWIPEVEAPLWLVLGATFLVGMLVGVLLALRRGIVRSRG